ncbi:MULTISPECIES: IclR family transcriptional regulator [Ramlibacter]|uniref:Helix-turn-helix domain-containing protein n=1 Tax=Ramlibacter pinisoli TaxID=2682844 RepID=A0A6N8J1B2_9BURK|nr:MULTISPECIES: IclR family transcriptional regulator [Ramlibacter]MBA2962660.1 IclR family transcriptional regulator [Ramlibacter sp. CGMCC 1.13660]MVQ32602.1 helix-turn-helix domain-containing protein [Ramlibacter pinisoli]
MGLEKRVKAADRTLDLFEAFQKAGRPMSLSEIALAMDIPVSSCHGLVNTLVSRGYLGPVGGPRSYYPSRLLYELGRNLLARDPVLSKVTPILEVLRDKCGETVVLGRRLDKYVQYVHVLEAAKTIRYTASVSDLRSLHSSALGKALLGALPEERRAALVQTLDYERVTPNTVPNAKRLLADVAAGEARGWHMTQGESVVDVAAVAKWVLLGGEPHAVAIAGPLNRMAPLMEKHARLLTAANTEMAAATS